VLPPPQPFDWINPTKLSQHDYHDAQWVAYVLWKESESRQRPTRVVTSHGGLGLKLMDKVTLYHNDTGLMLGEYRVVGIAEVDGGVYNASGLDIISLMEYRQEHKTIVGFPGGEAVDSCELLLYDCDILLPAAKENQITTEIAGKLQCRILCEGANGPTTPEADAILEQRGIFVIPDILANAGGVTVSYFEWVQDRQGYFWTLTEVRQRLDEIMRFSFYDVTTFAEKHGVRPRIAAYMLAIDRVASAVRLRGIYA